MRNLVLLDVHFSDLVLAGNTSHVAAIATDPSSSSLYAILQTAPSLDGSITLSVFLTAPNQLPSLVTEWSAEAQVPYDDAPASAVVNLQYLPESDSLVVVLANGDIEQIFEPAGGEGMEKLRENVGSVEDGIKAAAWSPDEELLIVITGDDKLIEMTKDFEVLSEGPLRSTEFGEDAPVNVGWGDKSTQFRGSVGKSASSSTATPAEPTPHPLTDDDRAPRISWRGDAAFFAVSSLDPIRGVEGAARRSIRIFSRLAALSSTSESTGGLEQVVSWQPSGSIIASTQKLFKAGGTVDSHHVVFFERNGLRRYDFALREPGDAQSRVRELSWNSDSTLLAVWIQRKDEDIVQLWHRNNYYWYLKEEISPRLGRQAPITSLLWHPENALELYIATKVGIESYSHCWDTFTSARPPPLDDGSVAVVDGSALKLTPFRIENVPPPMCSMTLPSSRPYSVPIHISFSSTSDRFVALYADGFLEVWAWPLSFAVAGEVRDEIVNPTLVRSVEAVVEGEGVYAKQCACVGDGDEMVLAVLIDSAKGSELVIVGYEGIMRTAAVEGGGRRLVAGDGGFVVESVNGTISFVSASTDSPASTPSSLPEFCSKIRHITLPTSSTIVGLSSSGRLYSNSTLIAADATSFTSTVSFLIYTTFTHESKFIPLASLERGSNGETFVMPHTAEKKVAGEKEGLKRTVERGSRIVTVVESSTCLVLQMPRGNLEMVYPRPLVLMIVRQDLDATRYRAAFLACRRHRIDLNILYDHNPQSFKDHLEEFVTQLRSVDYLNLFLSGLKNEDVTHTMYLPLIPVAFKASTATKINEVCDLVRKELEKRDVFHFANTILTGHVRKSPPDYESALRVLVELKAQDSARAEDAVKYIIFLSDADKLFDLALGMYDFSLVLMIAQHSQKDPREYLPFLRELREYETHYQRYKIDDHLARFESAILNLSKAGKQYFEEALAYTSKHGLFTTALTAYKDDQASYKTLLNAYAEHLVEKKDYAEAGLIFALGGHITSALLAYQKALAWESLFALALTEGKRPISEIKELAVEVAATLKLRRRYVEAGRVLLDYGRDVEAAVEALVEGGAFVEAIRLTTLYSRRDLIETHIKPGTLEVQSRMLEDFTDVSDQVQKQSERLIELRYKRDMNWGYYYCVEDASSAMDNVELQPDGASDAGTAFTRYTAARGATTVGGSTRRSSASVASKRKAARKIGGKKGTIFEETYLLASLKKTYEGKLVDVRNETATLLPVLLSLSSTAHRTAATTLQSALTDLERSLAQQLDTIWNWREEEWKEEQVEENKLKERGEFVQPPPVEEGMERVKRPVMVKGKWRIGLLDLK